MLKIDKISLADNEFSPLELAHLDGKAIIKNDGGVIAVGKFHMSDGGRWVMCAINAAGQSLKGGAGDDKNDAAAISINKPSDITVELTGKLKREFLVPAGETSVDTHCKSTTSDNVAGATGFDQATGIATVASVAHDRVVTLELEVNVGTGTASDDNVAHQIQIMPDNPEGLLHFAILCNVATDIDGRKPNKPTLEIRGAKPWKTLGGSQPVDFVNPAVLPTVDPE